MLEGEVLVEDMIKEAAVELPLNGTFRVVLNDEGARYGNEVAATVAVKASELTAKDGHVVVAQLVHGVITVSKRKSV